MLNKEIEWSNALSTDVAPLDQQHQELLLLAQVFMRTLSSKDATLPEKQAAFTTLVNHLGAHFDFEERILRNICFPFYEQHLKEHIGIREDIDGMLNTVMNGENEDEWEGLVSMVQVCVLRHISTSDVKIRKYIERTSDEGWET